MKNTITQNVTDTKETSLISSARTRIAGLVLGLGILAPSIACSRATPDAGQEVVLVKKPLIFGHGGVDPTPVTTGSQVIALTTDEIPVNMIPEQHTEDFDDIMTSDNVAVDFSAYIKTKVIDGRSPELISKFGKDWYKTHIQQIGRTAIRDEVAKYPMTSLTTRQELLNTIEKSVADEIQKFIVANHIPVLLQGVTLGKITPPSNIVNQLSETAAQQQRVKTEQEKAKAEAERAKSEKKRAEADKAYQMALGLTPAQYMELKKLEAQERMTWALSQGKANVTVFMGGANVQPVAEVGKK